MDFWLTALATIVGVLISGAVKLLFDHFVSGASLQQAQHDDDLEAIIRASEEARDRAIEYWAADDAEKSSFPLGAAISGRLLFIGQVVDGLFESDVAFKKAVNTELNRYDSAITHGNFSSKNRKAEENRSIEIEAAYYTLHYRVRRCRRKLKRFALKF